MDNTTAVAHVNNKGGTRSPQLVSLTLELWQWCLQRAILVTAQHLPGKLNELADRESREFYDSSEWQIDPQVIQPFLRGCNVDLFASRLTALPPTIVICQLETRPGCYLHRCNDPGLVPSKRLCLSTVQSNFSSAEENISGPSRPGLSGPSMPSTALVANSSEPSNQEPCHDPNLQTSAKGSCIFSENPPNVPQASSSRLSHIREQHQTEGFSEDVTEILLSATRASTRKTYQSAWGQWSRWCSKRKVNPISANLNDVLVFLTDRFKNGTAYRSVNVVRSVISSCHPKIDGYPVGQHPLVVQLLKGMLNIRPPKPIYMHTWDVRLVTKYLDRLGNTRLLTLKLLSIKLAMLLALSCPERVSSLSKLDLRLCRVSPEGISFTLTTPRKRGSPEQLSQAFFASFPDNKRLCPVDT